MLPHQTRPEHLPQQPERRVGHPVGAGFPRFRVMVEHAAAHIVHDAVKIIRHHKPPRHLNVGTQNLQQRRGKNIVGMKFAAVCKAFGWYFHGDSLLVLGVL